MISLCNGQDTIINTIKNNWTQNKSKCRSINISKPDIDKLIAEDKENEKITRVYRYGVSRKAYCDFSSIEASYIKELDLYVKYLKLNAEEAKSIDIVFSNYELKEGTKLYYLDAKFNKLGIYSHKNNQKHKNYVITTKAENSVLLVLNANSKDLLETSSLVLDKIIYGYKDLNEHVNSKAYGDSKACNERVFCASFLPQSMKDNEVRSVFWYRVDGFASTGALLNQPVGERDIEPLFLTARHSISTSNSNPLAPTLDLNTCVFFFNFSSPATQSPCSTGVQSGLQTRYEHPSQGATLIERDYYYDLALLEMNDNPPPQFNVYYAGWSAQLVNVSINAYSIHHPEIDIKSANKTIGVGSTLVGGNPRYIIYWLNGLNEHGSSGSPLFDNYGYVIGALSGGISGCTVPGPDYYGKLKMFHTLYYSVKTALSGGGTIVNVAPGNQTNCYENLTLGGNELLFEESLFNFYPAIHYQPDPHIQLNAEFDITCAGNGNSLYIWDDAEYTFQAGNAVHLLPNFQARNGCKFHAKIAPCSANSKTAQPPKSKDSSQDDMINDDFNTDITIVPNPNNGSFRLILDKRIDNVNKIILLNTLGKVVYENNSIIENNTIINCSNLQNGIYLLKIYAKNNYYCKKIVIHE